MDVKGKLHEMMQERGWSLYRAAKESGIPWSTLHNMFQRGTEPSLYTLEHLCGAMGVSLACFFDDNSAKYLTKEQLEMFRKWNTLSPKDRKLISDLIDSLAKE